MVDILVATHGDLSKSLVDTMEMLHGKEKNIKTIGLKLGESIENFKEDFEQMVKESMKHGEIIVLVDIIGGSPYNIACSFLPKYKFQLVSGVNLPMLLSLIVMRNQISNVEKLAKMIIQDSQGSIKLLNMDVIEEMKRK